jgi:glycosyltransferase involved in cell wall biosynthesis
VKVGIFDHVSNRLGGSQLVVAWMAKVLSHDHEVEVIHSGQGYTLSSLAHAFTLDLSRVRERIVENGLQSFAITGFRPMMGYLCGGWATDRTLTKPYDLFIYSGHGVPPFSFARQALIYCHFPFETRMCLSKQFGERWERRWILDRWLRLAVSDRLWERRMRGYATVLANSYFTSGWITRLWGRPAEVIYPPVAVQMPRVEKRNIIVSVGRFINTDRKNHTQQLQAFPKFLSQVGSSWSLCLIGFCADFPQDRSYLAQLHHLTKGLPVIFVVNAERSTVFRYLAEAKLFWHTTGFSNEGDIAPRYMEHFGIATVEAMAAGCVPIVPAYGGQPEIVTHQVSGFTCQDMDDLVRYSVRLAHSDDLWAHMSRRAIERSNAFRPDIFEQRFGQGVLEALGELGRQKKHHAHASISSLSIDEGGLRHL